MDKRRFKECLAMPFPRLVSLVFFPDGEPKPAAREVRMALILRLEYLTGRADFGNPETGELNEMEAWLAAIRLAERMDETNKKSKDVAES